MELEFWGVRGSAPVSGQDKVKFGGDTPCASIRPSGGDVLIIDAGTGLRRLGERLIKERERRKLRLHLLLTHFHLDHIIGLPFFAPFYSKEARITIYSPASPRRTEKVLSDLMRRPYFPVAFDETPAKKIFQEVKGDSFHIGKVEISWCWLRHPQRSIAYRIADKGRSIVFATDTEHPEKGVDRRLVALARNADLLVHDAMFTPEEYAAGKKGWGHTTWLEATKVAGEARVGNLLLSHLNPSHTDNEVERIEILARQEFPRTDAAREGLKKKL